MQRTGMLTWNVIMKNNSHHAGASTQQETENCFSWRKYFSTWISCRKTRFIQNIVHVWKLLWDTLMAKKSLRRIIMGKMWEMILKEECYTLLTWCKAYFHISLGVFYPPKDTHTMLENIRCFLWPFTYKNRLIEAAEWFILLCNSPSTPAVPHVHIYTPSNKSIPTTSI